MKTLQIFLCSFFFMAFSLAGAAQEKTESFKVSGNCGMCKSKIEKAAKASGASFASWNVETKQLSVKYNSTSANAAKIQEGIAKVGYDTPTAKATAEAYNALHGCCQYERETTDTNEAKDVKKACCADGICAKTGEPCKKDMSCCKDADGKCSADSKCNHTGDKACCKKA